MTAIAVATAIISITTQDGGKTASCTVTVTTKSSSGGGGSASQKPVTQHEPVQQGSVKLQSDGSVLIETQSMPEKETGLAYMSVSKETLQQALEDKEGIKKIVIKVLEIKETTGYAVELPSVTIAYNSNLRIELDTPKGSMTVPGNTLQTSDLVSSTVRLGIRSVQNTELKEDLRKEIGSRPILKLSAEFGGKKVAWNNPNSSVNVKISHTPFQGELKDYEHIVVWYIADQGQIMPVASGRYNPAIEKITFTTTHFSSYAVNFVKKTFDDIQKYSWAKNQIEVMASKDISNGTLATTFSLQRNITRADFMVLLVKTLGLTAEIDSNFIDVKPTDYYYEAVGIAKKLGITSGTDGNCFSPNAQITRQDMMVLVENVLRMEKKISITGTAADISSLTDVLKISAYAVEGVLIL